MLFANENTASDLTTFQTGVNYVNDVFAEGTWARTIGANVMTSVATLLVVALLTKSWKWLRKPKVKAPNSEFGPSLLRLMGQFSKWRISGKSHFDHVYSDKVMVEKISRRLRPTVMRVLLDDVDITNELTKDELAEVKSQYEVLFAYLKDQAASREKAANELARMKRLEALNGTLAEKPVAAADHEPVAKDVAGN
jgi:hypothetical protein